MQLSGGQLLPPVQKLVASILSAKQKAIKSLHLDIYKCTHRVVFLFGFDWGFEPI